MSDKRSTPNTPAVPVLSVSTLLAWCVEHDGECLGDHPALLERAKSALAIERSKIPVVTDEMVNRFLSWKLPDDFSPDSGISFEKTYNGYKDGAFVKGIQRTPNDPASSWPIGTNLFTAEQAKAMLEHVLAVVGARSESTALDAARYRKMRSKLCRRESMEFNRFPTVGNLAGLGPIHEIEIDRAVDAMPDAAPEEK